MGSDVIHHCQSPTEKVSTKIFVVVVLQPYLLTYTLYLKIFTIFGHATYELAFKDTSYWHYVNMTNQKVFRARVFLIGAIFILNVLFAKFGN